MTYAEYYQSGRRLFNQRKYAAAAAMFSHASDLAANMDRKRDCAWWRLRCARKQDHQRDA